MNDAISNAPICERCNMQLLVEVTKGQPFWHCTTCGLVKVDANTPKPETLDREDVLDDEEYQIREIYTQYGLTMYRVQVLEHGLVNALSFVLSAKQHETARKTFDETFDINLTQTMGKLMNKLRPFLSDDVTLGEDLRDLLELRNRITHSFFRDHAVDFMSPAGRELMLTEVIAAQNTFESMSRRMELVFQRFLLQLGGVSQEDYKNLMNTALEKLKAGETGKEQNFI